MAIELTTAKVINFVCSVDAIYTPHGYDDGETNPNHRVKRVKAHRMTMMAATIVCAIIIWSR